MLKGMTDEQRFTLTSKLAQEVLNAVVEGKLDASVGGTGFAVVKDTLEILCCPEIQLSVSALRGSGPGGADDDARVPEAAAAALHAAKSKLINQIVKKNAVEFIVPVVIGLKHKLENMHSPLLGSLMEYLNTTMKAFKNEVRDIMAADKQLASEIEFDLRQFQKQKEEQEQLRALVRHRVRHLGRVRLCRFLDVLILPLPRACARRVPLLLRVGCARHVASTTATAVDG